MIGRDSFAKDCAVEQNRPFRSLTGGDGTICTLHLESTLKAMGTFHGAKFVSLQATRRWAEIEYDKELSNNFPVTQILSVTEGDGQPPVSETGHTSIPLRNVDGGIRNKPCSAMFSRGQGVLQDPVSLCAARPRLEMVGCIKEGSFHPPKTRLF